MMDPGPRALRRLGWASLIANGLLIVTGGAVRLTGSGLGCPTWPRCTADALTPYGALDIHSAIEFGNRLLTFVLVGIAVATYAASLRSGRRDLTRLALAMALGIPAQALIGGVTVLTELNPWVVSFHLLCSLAIVSVAVTYLERVDRPAPAVPRRGPVLVLGWLTFGCLWSVLYVGTIVTGAGPHAGDADAPRNGLDPLLVSQVHADLVFLLVGLTVGLLVGAFLDGRGGRAVRAVALVLAVELAQGLIGFVQYFTDLPIVLVGLHLAGAGVLTATTTWMMLSLRAHVDDGSPAPPCSGSPSSP
jgi:cytochrome c oxidase assembly protein subunit 15